MRRLFVLLAVAAALAGCKGSSAPNPLDPFSRTRIEPPRTGWISDQPAADPYYSGTRQAALSESNWRSAGSGAAPPATPPPTRPRYTPRPGAHHRAETSTETATSLADRRTPPVEIARPFAAAGPGDRISIPLAARSTSDLSTTLASNRTNTSAGSGATRIALDTPSDAVAATPSAVATAVSAAFPANGSSGNKTEPERIVRTLEPRPRTLDAGSPLRRLDTGPVTAGRRGSGRTALPPGVVDIMNLPAVRSNSGAAASTRTSGVRLASAEMQSEHPSARASTAAHTAIATPRESRSTSLSPQVRYGYDPDYRWLKGRLEFSQIDRRWKLRYIPIDGTTDEFGGSVVVSEGTLPDGYERGEFVEVHGALGAPAPSEDTTYAPEFEVRQIARLGE